MGQQYLKINRMFNYEGHRVFVCFVDECNVWYLRVLRQGFRHCFILINDGERWLSIEPLLSCLEVGVLPTPADFGLIDWLRAQDHKIVETTINRKWLGHGPIELFTCVKVIKQFLGIHNPWIFTPHQLYQQLLKGNT